MKYDAFTKNKTLTNILLKKLQEKKNKHPNFEFDIITTTTNNATICKIVDII